MNLSFSTRGWPDLSWDAMIETALNMGFSGVEVYNLPKFDHRGKEIAYTVVEQNLPPGWQAEYGPVIPVGDSEIAYETTVTNTYRMTVELPGTGGIGPYGYITLGLLILFGSLGWYCGQRRKCERREC